MNNWSDRAAWLRVRLHLPLAIAYLWFAQPTLNRWVDVAGLVLSGLLFRGWAAGHLQKYEGVTVTGPYAYLRHPLYVGTAFLLAGLAVASGLWWIAGLIAVYFAAFFIPTLRREERFQIADHPDFYALYRALVPPLFPRLRLRPLVFRQAAAAGAPRFSFKLYLHNREWQATVGAAAILGLLYAKMVWE